MKRSAFDDTKDQTESAKEPVRIRKNYRCAAHGCPNAAAIDDHGEDNPGKCFFHWRAQFEQWGDVTRRIRSDESMRNHGIVPVKQAEWVREIATGFRGPRGLRHGGGA